MTDPAPSPLGRDELAGLLRRDLERQARVNRAKNPIGTHIVRPVGDDTRLVVIIGNFDLGALADAVLARLARREAGGG